jgi:hypothetical protein
VVKCVSIPNCNYRFLTVSIVFLIDCMLYHHPVTLDFVFPSNDAIVPIWIGKCLERFFKHFYNPKTLSSYSRFMCID